MINETDLEAFEYYTLDDPRECYTVTEMVQAFAEKTEQKPDSYLYATLIHEEYNEWEVARLHTDECSELKELADLVYVVFGYANAKGWSLHEAIERVHENNLGRIIQDDGTIKRRDDGKIMKNPNAPKIYLEDLV